MGSGNNCARQWICKGVEGQVVENKLYLGNRHCIDILLEHAINHGSRCDAEREQVFLFSSPQGVNTDLILQFILLFSMTIAGLRRLQVISSR